MSISCQDILLTRAITCLIHFGRDENASQQLGTTQALRVMSFISKTISSTSSYSSIAQFLNALATYTPPESVFTTVFLQHSYLGSIDEFLNVADDARLLFEVPNCSPNRTAAPFRLVVDSLLGIFVRTFLVKWECMSFSDLSVLFEVYQKYVAGTALPAEVSKLGSLAQVEALLTNNDLLPSLDSIHAYFDASPSQAMGADDPVMLLQSTKYRERHQHAMLSLACMWIRGEYYIYGTVAVEEAMKMSHQRGDHASIARALLLLYYVVQAHPDDHIGVVSAENVLLRCIDRAAELDLRSLEAQGKILLAILRSRQAIEPLTHQEDPTPQPEHHISSVWKLLTSTQYGTATKGSKASELSVNDVENAVVGAQALQVAAELWYRLGLFSMAQFWCQRAIRQYANHLSTEEIIYLTIRIALIASVTTQEGFPIVYYFNTSSNSADVAAILDRGDFAMRILNSLRDEFMDTVPTHLQRIFRTTENIIRSRLFLARRAYDTALQCALDAVDAIGDCKQTDLSFHAKFVQSLAETYFEKYSGIVLSAYIENRAGVMNYSLWKGEALMLRAAIDLYVKPYNISNAHVAIQQAKVLTQSEYIPLVDIKIARLEADLKAISCDRQM